MVSSVGKHLFRVLDMTNGSLTSGDICSMLLGPTCSSGASRNTSWSLDIKELDKDPGTCDVEEPDNVETYQVLHLSDLHVQVNYSVGSESVCKYPTCCLQDVQGQANLTLSPAGKWGSYSCDLPPWTFDRSLEWMARRHSNVDFIILTGDFPAHDVWMQDKTANLKVTKLVADTLKKHFPDTLVIPSVGNHESFPVNIFPDPTIPGEPSPHWLYSSIAKYFSHWLGKEQQVSLSMAGYFSVMAKKDLKVISVNSNF